MYALPLSRTVVAHSVNIPKAWANKQSVRAWTGRGPRKLRGAGGGKHSRFVENKTPIQTSSLSSSSPTKPKPSNNFAANNLRRIGKALCGERSERGGKPGRVLSQVGATSGSCSRYDNIVGAVWEGGGAGWVFGYCSLLRVARRL